MAKFAVSTDSTSDLLKQEIIDLNIFHAPLTFVVESNGKLTEYYDNFDSTKQNEEFFAGLKGGNISKTSMLTIEAHHEHFMNIVATGAKQIVHISLSGALSPTAHNAVKAAEQIMTEFSDVSIYCIDSKSATIGQTMLVHAAVKMRDAGKTAQEVANKLNALKERIKIYFMVDDLQHLKRGGRISGAKAVVGSVLSLKPILSFDQNGKLDVIEKVSGTRKAINTIASKVANVPADPEFSDIYLVHTTNEQQKQMLQEDLVKYSGKQPHVRVMGPVIGSHVGYGGAGFCYFSKN